MTPMKTPKGKRKSNAETYRDAMAVAKLVDVDCMEVGDAAEQLGLTRSTAYRLLSRARSMLLHAETEANRKAAEPAVRDQYEPIPPSSSFNSDPEMGGKKPPEDPILTTAMKLPTVEPVPTEPVPDEDDPWPWAHLMSYAEFKTRDPWRQKQLVAQWMENQYLSGQPFKPVLRGGIKNRNCFRGCPSYQCTCEDNL